MHTALLALYSLTIVSLVWARFRFFEFRSEDHQDKRVAWIYDPLAGLHIVVSYYFFLTVTSMPILKAVFSILALMTGELLFVCSVRTAKHLNFAQSSNSSSLVENGPFSVVRHSLYLSYSLIWLSSTLLFNSALLWITLGSLIAFYIFSAKREEQAILSSRYSREYMNYKNRVGMFLPRISQWISWILELSTKPKS